MPHPLLAALRITVSIVVVVVLIWGAYTLTQIRKTLEQLRKPQLPCMIFLSDSTARPIEFAVFPSSGSGCRKTTQIVVGACIRLHLLCRIDPSKLSVLIGRSQPQQEDYYLIKACSRKKEEGATLSVHLYSGPLVALFTPVLPFMLCVFMRADNLATTLRARDGALNAFFLLVILCHCSTSCDY